MGRANGPNGPWGLREWPLVQFQARVVRRRGLRERVLTAPEPTVIFGIEEQRSAHERRR